MTKKIVDTKLQNELSEQGLKCCSRCNENKPYLDFYKHKKEKDGYYYLCRTCAKNEKKKLNVPFPDETFKKECPCCKIELPAIDFGTCKERKDGVQYKCKKCSLNATRESRNSIEGRISFILSNAKRNLIRPTKLLELSITKNDLIELFTKQKGLCALSGIKMEHTINNNETIVENKYNISIDRINSDAGYTKENIQLVCWICNQMKSDTEPHLFINIITQIYKTHITL